MAKSARAPKARDETRREEMIDWLRGGPVGLRDLAKLMGMREKDAAEHLTHLQKSLKARASSLVVTPATCTKCDYSFEDRERFTRPGRCPKCKGERIEGPSFLIED